MERFGNASEGKLKNDSKIVRSRDTTGFSVFRTGKNEKKRYNRKGFR
jgi:hypothetical protein